MSLFELIYANPLSVLFLLVVCGISVWEFALLVLARSSVLRNNKTTLFDLNERREESKRPNALRNFLEKRRNQHQLAGGLADIGIALGQTEWIIVRAFFSLVCVVIGTITNSFIVGIISALCIFFGSEIWHKAKQRTINVKFEEQILQLEMQMAENSRAGLSIEKSLRSCQEQAEFPLQSHLDRLISSLTYSNMTLTEGFKDFAKHAQCSDVNLLANVIAVQQETGANLADTLDFLAQSITTKHKMRQTLRSRLAEMRLTKIMVSATPLAVLAICCGLINGVSEFYLSNPIGWVLLAICAFGELVGLYLLNKMSRIEIN